MKYNVISADAHVDLNFIPPDLFVSNAPAQWRDKVPRVVETEEGAEWWANGIYLAPSMGRWSSTLTPGNEERYAKMAATGFLDDAGKGRPHPTTVELRLKDQNLDGVDAEVIYGLTFTGGRLLGLSKSRVDKGPGPEEKIEPNPELVAVIYRIYNDWLADFCKQAPQRLAGLACLPNHDPEAAAAELRRATKLGLRGGEFVVQNAVKPIYYHDWDVLWRASAECNMPVSFHLVDWNPRLPEPEDAEKYARVWWGLDMLLSPMVGAEYLCSIILSGACERFPNFKFVLAECGATWLPYLLARLDHECTDFPGLRMKPSDYWRRQGYTSYQEEPLIGDIVGFVGEDNVMWANDYPHPDGTFPSSQEIIQRDLKNLKDEKVRRKILCDNAANLYGFK